MHFTFLSMPALCALLATASPVEKREPNLSHTSFDTISASASGLSKRFSLLSGGTVTINGKVYPPGSQPFLGVFVAGPGAPVCESYCLNVGVAANFKAQCAGRGCPDTEIVSIHSILFLGLIELLAKDMTLTLLSQLTGYQPQCFLRPSRWSHSLQRRYADLLPYWWYLS